MQKILIIQTAFIGDVILSTVLIEKLKRYYPKASIDFLLRKGNETLLENHPYLKEVIVWDKKQPKAGELMRLIKKIRSQEYDLIVNAQRFFTTGLMTFFSNAKQTIGFDRNPLSFLFSKKIKYLQAENLHEVDKNIGLIQELTDSKRIRPALYPSKNDFSVVDAYQEMPYLCIAPTSVWFTKQFPEERWIHFINILTENYRIFLLGGPEDSELCERLIRKSTHLNIVNLAGRLSLLQSAALMKDARMNYVNDSAPMHLASSMNAPVCVIYCSTIPAFGYGPLSDKSFIIQIRENLKCRPCGIHGRRACPLGHFDCGMKIEIKELLACLYQQG